MVSVLSSFVKHLSFLSLTGHVIIILLFVQVQSINKLTTDDFCFCKLEGKIGDCGCHFDTVDKFNNAKIYPRLQSLLTKDYFRFYKVNLKKDCPYWTDDSRCAMRFCHVKHCMEDEIPEGLKGLVNTQRRSIHDTEDMSHKYLETSQNLDDDCESESSGKELGFLNTTISKKARENFVRWQVYDDTVDNFCTLPDEDGDAQYVDLLLNPERFTGYKGSSAHRIWSSIYKENCFKPKKAFDGFIESHHLNAMCLEKRAFYRVISGLHSSINIHLCANYLLQDKTLLGKPGGEWGPNLEEFTLRFSPETTNGEGPERLKNLYFLYLLELRAVAKAAPYLQGELFYTGNKQEDTDTRTAIMDLLNVTKSFPEHFDESSMFNGGKQAAKLKEEFRLHFRNISTIMDCVGCDKCKLWGKLQIQGLGTALKILFSGKFDKVEQGAMMMGSRRSFHLQRSEIVALFNALGRLSSSIYHIETFRDKLR